MSGFLVILADVDAASLKQQFSDTRVYGMMAIFGSIVAAAVIGAIVAILYSLRKKRRKHRHHHHHHEIPTSENGSRGDSNDEEGTPRRRRRRRQRPMNPTLAQTGGLPPLRDENTPPHIP